MVTCPKAYADARKKPKDALSRLGLDGTSTLKDVFEKLQQKAIYYGAILENKNDPRVIAVHRCLQGKPHDEIADWVLSAACNQDHTEAS